jgi:hypothetical protein
LNKRGRRKQTNSEESFFLLFTTGFQIGKIKAYPLQHVISQSESLSPEIFGSERPILQSHTTSSINSISDPLSAEFLFKEANSSDTDGILDQFNF